MGVCQINREAMVPILPPTHQHSTSIALNRPVSVHAPDKKSCFPEACNNAKLLPAPKDVAAHTIFTRVKLEQSFHAQNYFSLQTSLVKHISLMSQM